jgi:hypothetical protein
LLQNAGDVVKSLFKKSTGGFAAHLFFLQRVHDAFGFAGEGGR